MIFLINIFKRKHGINLKTNDVIIVNGKKYLVGEHYFDNDITLHCIE
jgi:hypothetical protein